MFLRHGKRDSNALFASISGHASQRGSDLACVSTPQDEQADVEAHELGGRGQTACDQLLNVVSLTRGVEGAL
jgi:hypothetical protein